MTTYPKLLQSPRTLESSDFLSHKFGLYGTTAPLFALTVSMFLLTRTRAGSSSSPSPAALEWRRRQLVRTEHQNSTLPRSETTTSSVQESLLHTANLSSRVCLLRFYTENRDPTQIQLRSTRVKSALPTPDYVPDFDPQLDRMGGGDYRRNDTTARAKCRAFWYD